MDIAAMSISLNNLKVGHQVNTSVLKMAMDSSEVQSAELIKMLEACIYLNFICYELTF